MAQSAAEVTELPTPQKRKLPILRLLPIILLLGAGVVAWQLFLPKEATGRLSLSGRVEADETDIGAKTGGRIKAITVQEGDRVRAGQLVVELVDEEVPEQLRAASAQVASARQAEQQAKIDIDVAESRIQESEANLRQANGDSQGRVAQAQSIVAAAQGELSQAQAQVEQAQAQVEQAQAQVEQAKAQWRQAISNRNRAQTSRDRFAKLLAQGAVDQDQFDQTQTTLETAQAAVDNTKAAIHTAEAGVATAQSAKTARISAVRAAEDQIAANRGSLVQTQSTQLNPRIRYSQLTALLQQKQQAYSRLIAAQAQVKTAIATQRQIQERLNSFKVLSPIDGIVQSRPLEPGAVVATGRTLLTVINAQSVYLRGFIPEGDIGKVAVGMKARIFLDSNLKEPLSGKVESIDPTASFTPENIYFKQDRVRQVFGVKLGIIQTEKILAKPGMPADAEILLK